jgi:hypothetical protein
MSDEPNAHNHHHRQEELAADTALPPELEALAARLIADGAVWQSHLPDPAPVAERIRAIPHDHDSPLSASEGEGGYLMFEDTGGPPEGRRPALRDSRRSSLRQRLGSLAAVAVVLVLVGSMALVFNAVRSANGGAAPAHPTSTTIISPAALRVRSVTMAVAPASIAGTSCGTNVTVTYTATIMVTPRSSGGTVQFSYTVNNGRGQTPASVTFAPGETTKTYTFTWSGALPDDHTYPAPGGIQVTSPNQLTSPLVGPTGQCAPAAAPACGSNFSGSQSQSYQDTLTTDFGTVPLPPLSRTVPNNASGGQRGYDICSAGTASSITAFMEQNLPAYGWTFVSSSGGVESWKNGNGTINWSVPDPLEWNINWRVPLG